MISKELLSEVLDEPFDRLVSQNNRLINIETVNGAMVDGQYLDIYYVAHKCKEWAIGDGKYVLHSAAAWNYSAVCILNLGTRKQKRFHADTEPEAIFLAVQWILEENK